MNVPDQDPTKPLRRQVYWLLIAVAAAAATGRVLSTERVYEPGLAPPPDVQPDGRHQAWPPEGRPRPMPTFGSNDRSRWATVRALVDEGTFVIGRRAVARATAENPYGDYGIVFEDGWKTVDKVLNPEPRLDASGQETLEYYSSKPPLLTVLMAGEYWLLKHALGWSIDKRPYEIVRIGLLTFNVLPLLLYLWMIGRLAERFGATDWGRIFVVAAAAFGTLLTPFLITFNNHVPAAFAALAALFAALPVAFPPRSEETSLLRNHSGRGGVSPPLSGSGLFAALPVAFPPQGEETSPLRNHSGRGGVSPPFLSGSGRLLIAGLAAGFLVNCELPAAAFVAALGLLLLIRAPGRTLLWFAPPVLLLAATFLVLNHLATGQWLPVYEKLDTPWYQYPDSVWATIHPGKGRGIEFAKYTEPRWMYAVHLLFGHHGWFSLTPINLLGAAGMVWALIALARRRTGEGPASLPGWAWTAAGSLAVSVVVFVFYAFVTQTANYGGWTNGPRWLLWLTPLWLIAMPPVADWLGRRRWGRVLCLVLLALSVLSASTSDWNPWRPPWIYNAMESQNWLPY